MRRSRPGIRVLGYAVVSLCLASQAHAAEPIAVAASYPPWLMWVVLALAVLLWAGSSVMWAAIGLGGDPPVPARLTQGRVTRWIVPIPLIVWLIPAAYSA